MNLFAPGKLVLVKRAINILVSIEGGRISRLPRQVLDS